MFVDPKHWSSFYYDNCVTRRWPVRSGIVGGDHLQVFRLLLARSNSVERDPMNRARTRTCVQVTAAAVVIFFFFPSRKNYYELYAYTHYDAPIYLSICLCSRDASTGGSRYSPRRVRNHDNVKSQTSQNKSVQRAQGVIAGYVYRRRSTLRRKQHVSRICYIIITYMMFSNRLLRGS